MLSYYMLFYVKSKLKLKIDYFIQFIIYKIFILQYHKHNSIIYLFRLILLL